MSAKTIPSEFAYRLELLYTLNILTSTLLIRELGYDRGDLVRNMFESLDFKGIALRPDIMTHRLRLIQVFPILRFKRVKPCDVSKVLWDSSLPIRSIAIYPPSTMILSLFSTKSGLNSLFNVLNRYNYIDIYVFPYVVRSKPYVPLLNALLSGNLNEVISPSSLDLCYSKRFKLPDDWGSRPHIDKVDLAILNIVSLDPKITIEKLTYELSKKLMKPFTTSKVRKHVLHASRFIFGYRVSIHGVPSVSDVNRCYIVENVSRSDDLCLSIVRHPLSVSCNWSDEGKVLACFSVPLERAVDFHVNITSFLQTFGEVVEFFDYVFRAGFFAASTVPYDAWISKARSWRIGEDSFKSVLDRLHRYGCYES
ncbi:hypothetical protein Igag_1120 [Ignisphaera aggregans DSM 17230]|uniref:Uncharacterized protein n=1 Tax=Ignisphaera aggregans (strain DSM 17230 / JCM 13409 / AQ1.S1) TaxID=583356 RepID=E0SNY6_IGNAA|nr:hypothetical protein Igag_1120 [Ignisphaera aggregans DSM 17230]